VRKIRRAFHDPTQAGGPEPPLCKPATKLSGSGAGLPHLPPPLEAGWEVAGRLRRCHSGGKGHEGRPRTSGEFPRQAE